MTKATTSHILSQSGLIRFSGEDAQSFLHNQLSCDVAGLAPSRATYGAYCTPKGRALASFLLWRCGPDFFMQLPAVLREPIQKQLSKYILRSKVKATDATCEWTLIGLSGNDARSLAERALGQAPGSVLDVLHAAGKTVIRLPGERYQIAAPATEAATLLASFEAASPKASPGLWEWLDIRAGVPVILPQTQEAFVPQMVNLDLIGGVSFEKGCYPGQEIVARMHYRGTLKQRLYLAHLDGNEAPVPGDRLYSPDFGEQASGTVVNAAPSPEGGHDLLAVIQIASAAKGDIRSHSPGGPALKFLPMPYAITGGQ